MPSSKTTSAMPNQTMTGTEPDELGAAGPMIPGPSFSQPPTFPGPGSPDPAPPIPPAGGADSGRASSAGGRLPTPTDILPRSGKAFAKIAEAALRAVGGLLNRSLAVDEDDPCFLPDADDEELIPPPLGRLAARHVPLGKNADDLTELEDLGMLLVGLIAYGLKGLTDWAEARRERRRRERPEQGSGAAVFAGEQGDDSLYGG